MELLFLNFRQAFYALIAFFSVIEKNNFHGVLVQILLSLKNKKAP